MFVVCADEENKCCIDNERKGGRYETKKTRNKAETCRSHGGSYDAVSGGCQRLRRDECEGGGDCGNYFGRKCPSVSVCRRWHYYSSYLGWKTSRRWKR